MPGSVRLLRRQRPSTRASARLGPTWSLTCAWVSPGRVRAARSADEGLGAPASSVASLASPVSSFVRASKSTGRVQRTASWHPCAGGSARTKLEGAHEGGFGGGKAGNGAPVGCMSGDEGICLRLFEICVDQQDGVSNRGAGHRRSEERRVG